MPDPRTLPEAAAVVPPPPPVTPMAVAVPRCLSCGYVLLGLPDYRCPECGRPFDPYNPDTYNTKPPFVRWRYWMPGLLTALGAAVLLVPVRGRLVGVRLGDDAGPAVLRREPARLRRAGQVDGHPAAGAGPGVRDPLRTGQLQPDRHLLRDDPRGNRGRAAAGRHLLGLVAAANPQKQPLRPALAPADAPVAAGPARVRRDRPPALDAAGGRDGADVDGRHGPGRPRAGAG